MEYIVEKVGMSRTIGVPSVPVTLLKLKQIKVCEIKENGKALVAYQGGKKLNKPAKGIQKKYNLSAEFNKFAIISVSNTEAGDLDYSVLENAQNIKTSLTSKGRGFSGVIKRHGFSGGPKSHGSRFHRKPGSMGNCEWPGRIQKGQKMPGQYGNTTITVKNNVVSFDKENFILVVKGAVPGANGNIGRIKVVK